VLSHDPAIIILVGVVRLPLTAIEEIESEGGWLRQPSTEATLTVLFGRSDDAVGEEGWIEEELIVDRCIGLAAV
jgi:hypothetical protein